MTAGDASCLVCDEPGPHASWFENPGGRLVRCRGCRLVFQLPQPPEATLEAAYYHSEDFARDLWGPLRTWTVEQAEAKLTLLAGLVDLATIDRVLDVGCSSGAWLEVCAQRRHWKATGVEVGEIVAETARRHGLDVRTGTLDDRMDELLSERFELVTFWDVLEHLRDPRHELELATRLLAPGGLVAATFPNVEGWYPRSTYRVFGRTMGVWEYPELPVHLFDFSPRTARMLFERCGFEVLGVRTFSVPFGFYRATSLSPSQLGRGLRGRALAIAFDLLHHVIYPVALRVDRANWMMIVGRLNESSPPA